MTEHDLATEELVIRVLQPARAQRLIGEVVHVFEDEQAGHQPRCQRRVPRPPPPYRAEPSRQERPIDLAREPPHAMARVAGLAHWPAQPKLPATVARPCHALPPPLP